jgi:hypothetical protein
MATTRAVKTTTTMATKKVRATRARVTRAMTETTPREEGDDGHNNQLCTKATVVARTVVAMTARELRTAARAIMTGAKRVAAMTATMVTMTPNGNDDAKRQQRQQGPSNNNVDNCNGGGWESSLP